MKLAGRRRNHVEFFFTFVGFTGAPGAMEMNWLMVDTDKLKEPIMSMVISIILT